MGKTYQNPIDHKRNVIEDMGALRQSFQETLDNLDRIKVSCGVPKSEIESIKSRLNHAMSFMQGDKGPVRVNQHDLTKALDLINQVAKGKRRHLLFTRLEDGNIIEEFTSLKIRIE